MKTNLKRILVVDVEATCWSTREEQGDQPNEIIEIGVAELNTRKKEWTIDRKESIIVRPHFTKVSAFCTELTGWTQEDVDKGQSIASAIARFEELFDPSENDTWVSYGAYDKRMLSSDTFVGVGPVSSYGYVLGADNLPLWVTKGSNPFDKMTHLNVKTLFAFKEGLSREIGLAKALARLNMPLEGRHHNGADDAYNIAKIARHIFS
jgi:inhibitor of KinA sporulation pathway (predicted exonuclease)